MPPDSTPRRRRGFTLIEVLVAIGIIVLLISILLPVVNTVRIRAQVTSTQAQMARIQQAVMNYYHDWNAYPGPLSNAAIARREVYNLGGLRNVTSSENLALGLLGYLNAHYSPPGLPTPDVDPTTNAFYRPPRHDVVNLNPAQPKGYHYIDFVATEVSPGHWAAMIGSPAPPVSTDSTGQPHAITDTTAPEFVDSINAGIGPMPILYIRANTGAQGVVSAQYNPAFQYDASSFLPYGFTTPDQTDFPPPAGSTTQGPWVGYFTNPNLVNSPRGKDGFILISAGADRKYGTADDIIVTP